MRAPCTALVVTALASVLGAGSVHGCVDDAGPGVCVTTHERLPDQRFRSPTMAECEEYCDSVGGYVCCYYEPDRGEWMAIDGDC